MLPGDWGWYLATYRIDPATGGRNCLPEARREATTYEYPEHFKILPAINNWGSCEQRIKGGKKVAPGFSYTSDNNPHWMKPEELQAWIDAHTDKIGSI